jgi:hypothetical protein
LWTGKIAIVATSSNPIPRPAESAEDNDADGFAKAAPL